MDDDELYVELPTTWRAKVWDGTNGAEIKDLIEDSSGSEYFVYYESLTNFSNHKPLDDGWLITPRWDKASKEKIIPLQSVVAVSNKGKVKIMTQENFKRKYGKLND